MQFGVVLLSVAKCCSVMNIIRRHIDYRKLLLIGILLLSHPFIFYRFLFYQYMVVFPFNTVIYVFLLKESMYSYCSSMYSYLCLCILIVVHVFLDAATLTEVFPCFFLGCKANARV